MMKSTTEIKENIIKDLLSLIRKIGDYHVCISDKFARGPHCKASYIGMSFVVYQQKGLTNEEYMSSDNKPLLNSENGDGIEELMLFLYKDFYMKGGIECQLSSLKAKNTKT